MPDNLTAATTLSGCEDIQVHITLHLMKYLMAISFVTLNLGSLII